MPTIETATAWPAPGMAELLTQTQRVALLAAARAGGLRRTRHGYAADGEPDAYHQARTVFALERAGLLATGADGDTTALVITSQGKAVAGGLS